MRTPHQEEQCFCSTYNSVEKDPTTLSSGVVDDPRISKLAFIRSTRRGERQVSLLQKLITIKERARRHTPHKSTGNPVARHSHKRGKTLRNRKYDLPHNVAPFLEYSKLPPPESSHRHRLSPLHSPPSTPLPRHPSSVCTERAHAFVFGTLTGCLASFFNFSNSGFKG